MSGSVIQDLVAEKIKILYSISQELEDLFPGRHYTPDGHMIGSIGEALAACCYGLKLFEASEKTHDGQAPDGRLVQIKATQINRIAISSEPEWLLVLKIHKDGTFPRSTMGPANWPGSIAGKCRKMVSALFLWQNCGNFKQESRNLND